MQHFTVTLPLPSNECHQNARVPRWDRARAEARDKKLGLRTAQEVLDGQPPPLWGRATISLHFVFPNKRARDLLNYAAACKNLIDGIVEAGIVTDDKCTVLEKVSNITWEPNKDRVGVQITITPVARAAAAA